MSENVFSIGVIAESFRTKTLDEAFVKAAKAGCTGVQLYALSPFFDMLTSAPETLKHIRQCCDDNGLRIVSVCADLGGHGLSDVKENPGRIEKLKKILRLSGEFFSSRILTTHIGVVPRDTASRHYAEMVRDMRTISDEALSCGSVIAVETGPETPELLRRFLEDTRSRGAGVNLDPANLAMVHNTDAAEAVRILAPFIVHTHAKDGVHYRDCDAEEVYNAFAEGGFEALVARTGELFAEKALGEGQVCWDAYLAELKKIGYKGYLTIEREVGADPEKDIRTAVEFLRARI